jgi:membrane fusion protein, multidrug efflux system
VTERPTPTVTGLAPSADAAPGRRSRRGWRRLIASIVAIGLLASLALTIAARIARAAQRGPGAPATSGAPGNSGASGASDAAGASGSASGSASGDATARGSRGPAGRPVLVATAVARVGDVPVYVMGLGTVTPFYNVTVRTRVDGQLMRVPIAEGALVSKGDLIAEIDPRPFEAAVAQMEGQAARDRALLENARRDLTRYQSLMDPDAVPKQQLDTQASLVAQLQGTVQADEGQLASARLQVQYAHITAPIAGRVGLRLVDPGNIVHAADANGLLVITQVQPIAVMFAIAEDMLPAILTRLHSGATLPVDVFNRDGTQHLATGRLVTADNQIDPTTGTVKLKAMFENAAATLFPNQFVNARLTVDTQKQKVIVPPAAIRRGTQGTFVYVVRGDNTVQVRTVTVGATLPDAASIDTGLTAGERVVTDGLDDLRDGSRVQVAPHSASPSASLLPPSDAGAWGR